MSPVISVENILALEAKHGVQLEEMAISNDITYRNRACARGVLAIEAFGNKDEYDKSGVSIYSKEIANRLGVSYEELDDLEMGFLCEYDEEGSPAFSVGKKLREIIASR